MNWRSSFDMRLTYSGLFTKGVNKITVAYPTGKRLVFTNPTPSTSNVWYPPTGFYDVVASRFISHPSFYLRTKDQITYTFDGNGFLTGITDRYLNMITVNRSATTEAITSVVDSAGNSLVFSFSGNQYYGHYLSVTTPISTVYNFNITSQYYNPILKILRSVQFPPTLSGQPPSSGPYEIFGYDLGAAIISENARDGATYTASYDSTERLTSFSYPVPFYTNPISQTGNQGNLTYHYTYGSTATTLTDPYAKTIVDNYDSGTLRSEVDQQGYSQVYTWDNYYNCSQYKNQRQYTGYYGYDSYGNMIKSQDALQYSAGKSQAYTYNSWNDVLTSTDTRGAKTTVARDPTYGTVLTVKDGLNNLLVSNTYNAAGQLLTANTENTTATVAYDNKGRPSSVQTPDQTFTISYASPIFNLPNLPYTITDGLSRITTLWYDQWGRAQNVSRSSDGQSASVVLDALNRVTEVTDWKGISTNIYYDAAGRLTRVLNQTYVWWDMDRLAGVVDGNNHTRQNYYTVRGEMKGFQLADGATESYQFDGDGDQTSLTDGLYNYTQYYYDAADNQYETYYPDRSTVQYTTDYDGRTTSMVDVTGTTSWVYDFGDRLTNFNSPQGNLSYGYDQWGRRTSLTEPNSISISYAFTNQHLASINKQPENETTSWSYDQIGRVAGQSNSNGTSLLYGYDGLDRIASILHQTSSNSPILSEAYSYDFDGNLSSKTSNGSTTQYQYDNLGQLTGEWPFSGGQYGTGNITYAYDGNGNRSSKSVQGSFFEAYSYDAGDKLTGVTRNTGNGAVPYKSYTYDNAGHTRSVTNAQSGQTLNLNYDFEDRVTSITGLPTANQYSYNALDARSKKVDSGGATTYLRDGEDPTDDVLSDTSGYVYVPGVSIHSYLGTRAYHSDSLGTNKAETDDVQNIKATRSYDSFGMPTGTTGQPAGPLGYAGGYGYQEDGDSGLKLLGHRYYDASVGRFITRDPAQDGRNWYSYAGNDPTNAIDPSGFWDLIIHGNSAGVSGAGLADAWVLPGPKKGDVELHGDASKETVLEDMIECDNFYFFGHGSANGDLVMDGYDITPADLAYVARERQRRGKKKMGKAKCFSCWSANLESTVNLWLTMCGEFTGYPDVTAATWPDCLIPHVNPCQTFTNPVHYNPGQGLGVGGYSKKGVQKAGKGKNVKKGRNKHDQGK